MRKFLALTLLMLPVACKTTNPPASGRTSFAAHAFLVPNVEDENGGTEDGEHAYALADNTMNCDSDSQSIRCVRFLQNDDKSVTVAYPKGHPQAGQKITLKIAGIESPDMNARNSCEREAAAKTKDRITNLMETAKRIDLLKVKSTAANKEGQVLVDGRSLATLLQNESLVRPYGTQEKNWCQQ